MLGETTTPRGKSYMAVAGKEKAQKGAPESMPAFSEIPCTCEPGPLRNSSEPRRSASREPSPFDCMHCSYPPHGPPYRASAFIECHTEPARSSSGCQASGSSELHPEFPASPDRLSPNFFRELYLRVQSRSSTVLLTPRVPSTSKTLARGRYDLREGRCLMFGGGRGSRRKEAVRGRKRLGKEHSAGLCLSRASLGLSETLPSLDSLPLGSFSAEPAPFDCTDIILDTGLRAESLCLYRVLLPI